MLIILFLLRCCSFWPTKAHTDATYEFKLYKFRSFLYATWFFFCAIQPMRMIPLRWATRSNMHFGCGDWRWKERKMTGANRRWHDLCEHAEVAVAEERWMGNRALTRQFYAWQMWPKWVRWLRFEFSPTMRLCLFMSFANYLWLLHSNVRKPYPPLCHTLYVYPCFTFSVFATPRISSILIEFS